MTRITLPRRALGAAALATLARPAFAQGDADPHRGTEFLLPAWRPSRCPIATACNSRRMR